MSVYPDGQIPVNPQNQKKHGDFPKVARSGCKAPVDESLGNHSSTTLAARPNSVPALTTAVTTKFLRHLSTDPYLTDYDVRLMSAMLPRMTAQGRWRGTDDELSPTSPASVYVSLQRLSERGYLEPLGRKEFGERDLVIGARYTSALRSSATSPKPFQREETQGQEIQAEGEEIQSESPAVQFRSSTNSKATSRRRSSSSPKTKDQNKETPNEESLTRGRGRARKDEEPIGSESLCSDSSSSDKQKHSLKCLAEQYGVGHFPLDVIQAADAFDDLAGSAHYNMVYSIIASSDQDVWAEGVENVLTRWRAGDIQSPRPYIATAVRSILEQREDVMTRREHLAKKSLWRKSTVDPAAPPTDDEFEARVAADPFSDDVAGDEIVGSRVSEEGWQAPEEQSADQPAQAVEPDQPTMTRPERPKGLRKREGVKVHPTAAPDPIVIANAAQRLGLDVSGNDLASLYMGVCKGRLEVFLLAVRMAELAKAKSPMSFIAMVAQENVGKDAQWLRDRTDGLTAAECAAKLKEFEAWLELEKTRLNQPMTRIGGFRSDTPSGIGTVLDTLPLYKGMAKDDGLRLPTTPKGWAALQEAMTAMRGKYEALSDTNRKACDDSGRALASEKVARDDIRWEDWRKLGVYHASCALIDAQARTENVRSALEKAEESMPDDADDGSDADDGCGL